MGGEHIGALGEEFESSDFKVLHWALHECLGPMDRSRLQTLRRNPVSGVYRPQQRPARIRPGGFSGSAPLAGHQRHRDKGCANASLVLVFRLYPFVAAAMSSVHRRPAVH
jgi:hypothetical protein